MANSWNLFFRLTTEGVAFEILPSTKVFLLPLRDPLQKRNFGKKCFLFPLVSSFKAHQQKRTILGSMYEVTQNCSTYSSSSASCIVGRPCLFFQLPQPSLQRSFRCFLHYKFADICFLPQPVIVFILSNPYTKQQVDHAGFSSYTVYIYSIPFMIWRSSWCSFPYKFADL